MTSFRRSGPRITGRDVARVEAKIGSTLPTHYRMFLLKYNGGNIDPNTFFYHHKRLGRMRSWVEDLFPIMQAASGRITLEAAIDIANSRRVGDGRIPKSAMPIGDAAGGELLMFVRGPRRGEIWFKNRDEGKSMERPMAGMHLLAADFDEFVGGMLADEPTL